MLNNSSDLPLLSRDIASVVVFSADSKVLMGKKGLHSGGVYADSWHIPGGGIEVGESKQQAAIRELYEETGIVAKPQDLIMVEDIGHGEAEKTKDNIKYWCIMAFYRFVLHLPTTAAETKLCITDDLVELRWFDRAELKNVQQIPGGREFFIGQGWIDE